MLKIGELANKSGVSIRALRYYEEIGLLLPSEIKESGYRLYNESDALKLQQILFYKEIGYSLKEIKNILENKSFDLINSLEGQKKMLLNKRKLYSQIINTIDETIQKLKGNKYMNIDELYSGLPISKEYREEAISQWGDDVKKSESSLLKLHKSEIEKLNNDFKDLWTKLAESSDQNPESDSVQSLINKHIHFISIYWGVDVDEISDEKYLGLVELYCADSRFTTVEGISYPKMGVFLKKAINHFIDNRI